MYVEFTEIFPITVNVIHTKSIYEIMIKGISHIVLYTTDMQRSIAFYKEVLGLNVVSESEYWSEVKVAEGETYLGLHSTSTGVPKEGTTEVTFRVDDIDKAEEWLKSKDVKITRDKNEIAPTRWIINFVDPDDNPLSVYAIKK